MIQFEKNVKFWEQEKERIQSNFFGEKKGFNRFQLDNIEPL